MESIGERIRELRAKKEMSQTLLASRADMTVQSLWNLENGMVGKTFEKLPAIAKALGCHIDDLFPEMDGYTPEAGTPSHAPDPPGKPADGRDAAPAADADAPAPPGDAAPAASGKPTSAALDADNWWELLGLEW